MAQQSRTFPTQAISCRHVTRGRVSLRSIGSCDSVASQSRRLHKPLIKINVPIMKIKCRFGLSTGRYGRCQRYVHQNRHYFHTLLLESVTACTAWPYSIVVRHIVNKCDVAASTAALAPQNCYHLLVAGHTSQTIQNHCAYFARRSYDLDFRAPVSTRCGTSAASQGARPRHSACASPKWGLRAQQNHSMVMIRRPLAFLPHIGNRMAQQVPDESSSA